MGEEPLQGTDFPPSVSLMHPVMFFVQFRVFMRHPRSNEMVERKIEVHKDKSLREATQEAYKVCGRWQWVWLYMCEDANISCRCLG